MSEKQKGCYTAQSTLQHVFRFKTSSQTRSNNSKSVVLWHIVTCITLPRDKNFAVLQSKGIHEILPEAQEFRRNTSLIRDIWSPLREASPNGLFYPNHVGEIYPCPRVRNRRKSSILPKKRPVLLQQTFKRAASRSAVEPDSDFVLGKRIRRWEVPEVKFSGLVDLGGYW